MKKSQYLDHQCHFINQDHEEKIMNYNHFVSHHFKHRREHMNTS